MIDYLWSFERTESYMDSIESLQAQLAELTKTLSEAAEVLKPIQDEEIELNTAEFAFKQTYKEKMAEFAQKRMSINDKKYAAQKLYEQAKSQAAMVESTIQAQKDAEAKAKAEAEAAAKKAEAEATLIKRFDMATMGAPWREWAKDHQIKAGHKLTEDRYVILADPMGLGKTLSSIITADMAEKVTRDASPEFPFLGQEEEVYVHAQQLWSEKIFECISTESYKWPFNGDNDKFGTLWNYPENKVELYFNNRLIVPGAPVGYMGYDLQVKLINEGYIEKIPAHYETKIVNSITRPVGRKILYFCPSPLLRNVLEEWRRWAPHRNVTYIGNMSKAERNFVLDLTLPKLDDYVIIVNYEAWRRDKAMLEKLIECKFDTIIIDEAHSIKDTKTGAYKGVKKVIDETKPEYLIPMTGTPLLNKPEELFTLLNLVNPKDFYNERDFLFRYCEPIDANASNVKYRFKPGGLDVLAKKITKNFMRRTKDQAGIVLPDKTITYHELDRDDENYPDQAKARKHMKDYATIVIDESAGKVIQATVIIALITRLRQIETWPAGIRSYETMKDPVTGKTTYRRDPVTNEKILKFELDVYESQKIDYIIREENGEWEGLIPDTIQDERIVVFSQFKEPLHEMQRRVERMGYKAAIFDGDTPDALKDEIRHDFDRKITPNRSEAKYDVLLANYKAAGVGLNLTGATQLITLDEEWNPGKREQAWDRIHRIGQTENVTINVIRTKNTIDDWLSGILAEKDEITSGFEQAATGITMSDLKDAIDSGLI